MRDLRLKRLSACRLYAITPDLEPPATLALVGAWLEAGVGLIQLRNKTLARGAVFHLASSLASRCRERGALLIVNDHADIAVASGADGVHLGDEDLSVAAGRRVCGAEMIVGASAQTVDAAVRAVREGCDYLGSGPAFPTPLKPAKQVIGPAGIAAVQAAVEVPVFAIGGVTLESLDRLEAAGIARVCAIRALAEDEDPGREAGRWLRRLGGPWTS